MCTQINALETLLYFFICLIVSFAILFIYFLYHRYQSITCFCFVLPHNRIKHLVALVIVRNIPLGTDTVTHDLWNEITDENLYMNEVMLFCAEYVSNISPNFSILFSD